MKEGGRHYHFYATPEKVYSVSDVRRVEEGIYREMLDDFVKKLEEVIRLYPLQWFNYYSFWED